MKNLFLTFIFSLLLINLVFGEGTRQLAPNGNTVINGTTTTDVAALHINSPAYNNFAAYTNPDPNNRLYINIADPANECIYLGFSFAHPNVTSPNPPQEAFAFRILDPNGNVVYGSAAINPGQENILNWAQAFNGPSQLNGPNGYDAIEISSADLTSQGWNTGGDFYIQFQTLNPSVPAFLIDHWDITVVNCSGVTPVEKPGRVWSYNWAIFAINDFGFPNRPFNGAFYVCAPDPADPDAAFVTKIDFNAAGFRPAAFNIAFNSFGSQNTGNVITDRRSVQNFNSTQSEYAIFLNDPVEVCETGVAGEIEVLGLSRCDINDYFIKFTTTKEGQIDLVLDFDGDGAFTPGSADIIISKLVGPNDINKVTCVEWDGFDGLGNFIIEDVGTQIPIILSYAQGINHFPIYDAELMTQGVNIVAVRPPGPDPLLYYDDSDISSPSGSGEPAVQLAGCTLPCHRWTNYTDPNLVGFGNLNTINSWWFSQQVITEEVLFLSPLIECTILGPDFVCEGDAELLTWEAQVSPAGADLPEIVSTIWSGPGILGPNDTDSIEIDTGGLYTLDVNWLTDAGDTCMTSCEFLVDYNEITTGLIDTVIFAGEVIVVNGEVYTDEGQFIQTLMGSNGCDSILIIIINVIQNDVIILHYDLNDCEADPIPDTHMDYSEFEPEYPEDISCAVLWADILNRSNPTVNTHSCTPGVQNTPAICVSALDDCNYDPGNEKSVVFEVIIKPITDLAVEINSLTFWEKAPPMFNWIGGDSGPNNPPTLYGLRVLRNGVEIFREVDIATTPNWTLEKFTFVGDPNFRFTETTLFQFELLGYCLEDNGAQVAAWDLDEITLRAGCFPPGPSIVGTVNTFNGQQVEEVEMKISPEHSPQDYRIAYTDETGNYLFEDNDMGKGYRINAAKDDDYLNGVSTLDILYMRNHLLGTNPFVSPFQLIAADVNNSGNVSTIDLVELRKLLLGISTTFPNNTPWRFAISEQVVDHEAPWDFKEEIEIVNLFNDLENQDFIAVKIGDINGDVQANSSIDVVDFFRTDIAVRLMVNDIHVKANEPITIDFMSPDFKEIKGLQFALDFGDLELRGFHSGELEVSASNYHSADGIFTFSWDSNHPISLSSEDLLFSIEVMPSLTADISGVLKQDAVALKGEAYLGDRDRLSTAPIELTFNKESSSLNRNVLYQNVPNPWSGNTKIRFNLGKGGFAELVIYDVSGKALKRFSGYFDRGTHEVELTDPGASGVIWYQLKTIDFVDTKKMVRKN